MKKSDIEAIELLQERNKKLERDIASYKKTMLVLSEKIKSSNKKIEGYEVEIKAAREFQSILNDFAISAKGTPTVTQGWLIS